MELYNQNSNLTVIPIRGTHLFDLRDYVQDLDLFLEVGNEKQT